MKINTLQKIVSGGQTGVDRAALDAALAANFPCGGWCPEGRLAEDGRISTRYPLTELPGSDYVARTRQNVVDSDGTLIFYFGKLRGGTEKTMHFCQELSKPYQLIDGSHIKLEEAVASALTFIREKRISVLNVAGPRASQFAAGHSYAYEVLAKLIAKVS